MNFGSPGTNVKTPIKLPGFNLNTFLIIIALILISFIGVFYYLGINNYFKSQMNSTCEAQVCQVCPTVTCGDCRVNLTCGNSNATAVSISNATVYINNTNQT